MVFGPFTSSIEYRVYFKDTDAGGIMYHSKHIEILEIGRYEFLREHELNPSYILEKYGILYPVLEVNIKYHYPAKLDDLLTLSSELVGFTPLRVNFEYTLTNQNNKTIATAQTTNVSIDSKSMRPVRTPAKILDKFSEVKK